MITIEFKTILEEREREVVVVLFLYCFSLLEQ